jgi:hypothetical protein
VAAPVTGTADAGPSCGQPSCPGKFT